MIANRWYCIAQTSVFDTGCSISVVFGDSSSILLSASVKYGSASLNISNCSIEDSYLISARLREADNKWCVDILSNIDITPSIEIADNEYWVKKDEAAGSGNQLAIIKDISKDFNTSHGGAGESFFERINIGSSISPVWVLFPKDFNGNIVHFASKGEITAGWKLDTVPSNAPSITLGEIVNVDNSVDSRFDSSKILIKEANATHWTLKDLSEVVGLDTDALAKYLTTNKYVTESWVENRGYALQADLVLLRSDFDALSNLLNDDVSGVIDTWNDVKSFLEGYRDSEDLATILSMMNSNIDSRAKQSDLTKAVARIAALENLGLEVRTLSDGTKVLVSIHNFASEGEITAGGVGDIGGLVQGSVVTYNQILNSGTAIGEITIDGVTTTIYAPVATGGGGLDVNAMWDALATNDTSKVINVSHIPTLDWSKIVSGTPTTLAGYGITDALSTTGGTITGALTIKPAQVSGFQDGLILHDLGTGIKEALKITWKSQTYSGISLYPNNNYTNLQFHDGANGYEIIHAGNIRDYALPLNGEISGAIDFGTNNSAAAINRGINFGSVAHIGASSLLGIYSTGKIALRPNGGSSTNQGIDLTDTALTYNGNAIIHSGNYSDYALPLSGGTINGTTANPLSVNTTNSSQTFLQIRNNSANKSAFGWFSNANYGTFIYSYAARKYLGIKDDGTPYYDGNTLIHSGNYSEYALPLSGGTLTNTDSTVLKVNSSATSTYIQFMKDGSSIGYLGYVGSEPYTYYGGFQKIIHSGNIGSYNAGSATKLKTARTIWGQSFDGSGNVEGIPIFKNSNGRITITNSTTNDTVYLQYEGSGSLALVDSTNVLPKYIIVHSGNIGDYISSTGGNYLSTLGGTITGNLTVNGTTNVKDIYASNNYIENTLEVYGMANFYGAVTMMDYLDVVGDIYMGGELVMASDMRYKQIIEHISLSNDIIANAPIFKFIWIDKHDNKLHIGTSAQYWQAVDAAFTTYNARNGKLSLDYLGLAVAMGKSNASEIKQLKQSNANEIKQLKQKIVVLENKLQQHGIQ